MRTCYASLFAMRLPFALLPTVLSDVRHMGLLLAGAGGVLEDAGVSCRHHPWWLAPYYLRRGCRVFSCLISSPTVFLLTFDAYIYSYLGYLSSSRHFCHADFLTFPLSSSSLMMLRLYMTLKDTSD